MSTRGWLEAQIEALTIECGKRQAEVERLKQRNAERERAIFRAGQQDAGDEMSAQDAGVPRKWTRTDAEVDAAIADATKGAA